MKRLLCVFVCAAICAALFAGCAESRPQVPDVPEPQPTQPQLPPAPTEIPPEDTGSRPMEPEPVPAMPDPLPAENLQAAGMGLSGFDDALIQALCLGELGGENFTFSPLSYRSALALAAYGAEGETRAQLLQAMGFADLEEMTAWYAQVLGCVDGFHRRLEHDPVAADEADFRLVNSVWKNQDLPGDFRSAYLSGLEDSFRATADSAPGQELGGEVNRWVEEQTKGQIRDLVGDLSMASAVLVNALYLKSGWTTAFNETGEDVFTTLTGESVQKPYMEVSGHYDYYRDEDTQLVRVTLRGGVSMVFVLGDDSGLAEKLSRAEDRLVHITVPEFEVETTLDGPEMKAALEALGCSRLFTPKAELESMFTEPLYVDEILQKARVCIDPQGLEAAAATAMVLYGTGALPKPEEPELFRADRPFRFCILADGETPQLLFWGQIVR